MQIHTKAKEEFNFKMTKSNIYEIIKNPFYGGQMLKQGKLYPHNYPLIIDSFVYERAMEIFNSQKLPSKKTGVKVYPFRALMRCAECNCTITPEKQKGIIYYHCTQSKFKHNAPYINEKDIAWILKDHINQVLKEYPEYKSALKIDEWNIEYNEMGTERIRIVCGRLFKKLFLHKNKSLTHELYTTQEITRKTTQAPTAIVTQEGTLKDTIRILCNMPHSLEELMAITQKDMADIQMTLIDMQIDGIIDQDELGNWKNV